MHELFPCRIKTGGVQNLHLEYQIQMYKRQANKCVPFTIEPCLEQGFFLRIFWKLTKNGQVTTKLVRDHYTVLNILGNPGVHCVQINHLCVKREKILWHMQKLRDLAKVA